MRAVRFGSYSMLTHLGRHADLVALEVDDAEALLVAAAAEARGDAAVVVAAAGRGLGLEQRLCGRAPLVSSEKSGAIRPRCPGLVGFGVRRPMV